MTGEDFFFSISKSNSGNRAVTTQSSSSITCAKNTIFSLLTLLLIFCISSCNKVSWTDKRRNFLSINSNSTHVSVCTSQTITLCSIFTSRPMLGVRNWMNAYVSKSLCLDILKNFISCRTAQVQICVSSVIEAQQYILTLCDTGQYRHYLWLILSSSIRTVCSRHLSYESSLLISQQEGYILMLKEQSVGFHVQYGRPKGLLFPVNKLDAINGWRQ